jgi:hypothetical protein
MRVKREPGSSRSQSHSGSSGKFGTRSCSHGAYPGAYLAAEERRLEAVFDSCQAHFSARNPASLRLAMMISRGCAVGGRVRANAGKAGIRGDEFSLVAPSVG